MVSINVPETIAYSDHVRIGFSYDIQEYKNTAYSYPQQSQPHTL